MTDSAPLYTTEELTERLYKKLKAEGHHNTKIRLNIIEPAISFKNGKTFISNMADVCESIGRSIDEVITFINNDMSLKAYSIKEGGVVMITGKYDPSALSGSLERYIQNYVICQHCRSTDTYQDTVQRRRVIACRNCGDYTSMR